MCGLLLTTSVDIGSALNVIFFFLVTEKESSSLAVCTSSFLLVSWCATMHLGLYSVLHW